MPPIKESEGFIEMKMAASGQFPMDVAIQDTLLDEHNRERTDRKTAATLGYDSFGLIGTEFGDNLGPSQRKLRKDDLVSEIEDNRYFVVLLAYDFQMTWKQKKHKLLWETRFSMCQRHHNFDKDLPRMAEVASHYFGRDSNGLSKIEIPEGRVEIGDVKSLGEVETDRQAQPAAK
jgi:hypothetical protein